MCDSFLKLLLFLVLMSCVCGRDNAAETAAAPALTPRDAVWQPVAGTMDLFYVYSAYVERRMVAAVRIIAATKTKGPDAVLCRLQLRNNHTVMLLAEVKPMKEKHDLKYSGYFVLCHLHESGVKPDDTIGASVSVVSKAARDAVPSNLLKVQDTRLQENIKETLHVCVKPLHSTYSLDEWLVEWLELHQLLGASHFYMYNSSISSSVGCLLDRYVKRGLVTLLPWRQHFHSEYEMRTKNLYAAFNDCLYRSMSSASWLLIVDVDEVVLPRRRTSLIALLKATQAINSTHLPGTVLFKNANFYIRWPDDPAAPTYLVTARKTRRTVLTHKFTERSKYAVRPNKVIELATHFVWEIVPKGCPTVEVTPEEALLHHYRVFCDSDDTAKCLEKPSTVDQTAHRLAAVLSFRVNLAKKQMAGTCFYAGQRPKYLDFNDGNKVPAIAVDTSTINHGEALTQHYVNMILFAMGAGFEHFVLEQKDEKRIGRAMEFLKLDRFDIFLTVKLDTASNKKENVLPALRKTLKDLKTFCVDLYLMTYEENENVTQVNFMETWGAMEVAKSLKIARSIGVVNFNLKQMKRLWKHAKVQPSVLLIEVNPTRPQSKLIKWCQKRKIVVMAGKPFGTILDLYEYPKWLIGNHRLFINFTEKYEKTLRQILLRYLMDRSLIPICAVPSVKLIREVANVFDFSLRPHDVEKLSTLNKNLRNTRKTLQQQRKLNWETTDNPNIFN